MQYLNYIVYIKCKNNIKIMCYTHTCILLIYSTYIYIKFVLFFLKQYKFLYEKYKLITRTYNVLYLFAQDNSKSAQRFDDRRREFGIAVFVVAALLARQSWAAYRQQHILYNSMDSHEGVDLSDVVVGVLLKHLVDGIPLPASITSHCLSLRFVSSKILLMQSKKYFYI